MSIDHSLSTTTKAVIYCRVSSKKQASDGSGLESQEHRCREYAASKGYHVDAVFPDDVSGGGDFMQRPGMVALLAYLDAMPDQNYVVIFDDLKRYARDTEFHLKLRRMMAERGATRECLNFNFEDTPEGKFIETMLAAQGELEREQNGRQVVQKMKARVEQGYWVFRAPVGYRYTGSKRGGKELVLDEVLAPIVTEALEGFASGRFQTQAEVKRFLESFPEFPQRKNGEVIHQRVTDILTNPIYAGLVDHPRWGVHRVAGRHKALISFADFEAIQQNRSGIAKAPTRKNLNVDFPLRGFVCCAECQKPLTSCWSTGKYKKYPYYLCDTKGCASYRKSIARARIEDEFEDIIKGLQPSDNLFALVRVMFKTVWDQRVQQAQNAQVSVKKELATLSIQIEGLFDRLMDTQSPAVIKGYESKIDGLEKQRLILQEKSRKKPPSNDTFEHSIELSLAFLSNPWKLWASGQYHLRRLVLRLAFLDRIAYHRFEGYRTPKTALPFKVLESVDAKKNKMVRSRCIELLFLDVPNGILATGNKQFIEGLASRRVLHCPTASPILWGIIWGIYDWGN